MPGRRGRYRRRWAGTPRDAREEVTLSIESVKDRFEDELLALPNVVGVGIGERAGKPVIKVFVTSKVPTGELEPEQVVPRAIEGEAVDVEAIGEIRALS